jgi:hypothetical protein
MPISDNDIKLLWGRAAGICTNPTCREDLTVLLKKSANYNIGEMAHVIAKNKKGPRGIEGGGLDTYENLILLCPTCHRHIDKSPEGTYTADQLHEWKRNHETAIRSQNSELVFDNVEDLKKAVSRLLIENNLIWKQMGPQSQVAQNDPGSNSFKIWNLRKLDTIIPNNYKITNMIEKNSELLNKDEYEKFILFKNHAVSFEANQYGRLDNYPTFPKEFGEAFSV